MLEPGGQKNSLMLEILPGRFRANFAPTFVGQEMHPMVGKFALELGVAVHPRHGARFPERRHACELVWAHDTIEAVGSSSGVLAT